MTVDIHRRLSVSSLCTYRWTFAEELALWRELGVRRVAPFLPKLDAYGHDRAVRTLQDEGMIASSVVAMSCDLRRPDTWAETQTDLERAVDTAVALGAPCIYIATGRTTGQRWGEVLDVFATAVAPTVTYATARGVKVALEASPRAETSFVSSVRDALDVCDRTGLRIVADCGACWLDRDVDDVLVLAGERIAIVQLCDAAVGTFDEPKPGRMVPGDGEIDLDRFVNTIASTGYTGDYELEMVGPAIEAEGYESALRRGIERVNELLTRHVG